MCTFAERRPLQTCGAASVVRSSRCDPSSMDTGAVIGIVIGAVLLVALVACVVVCLKRRKRLTANFSLDGETRKRAWYPSLRRISNAPCSQ